MGHVVIQKKKHRHRDATSVSGTNNKHGQQFGVGGREGGLDGGEEAIAEVCTDSNYCGAYNNV